MNTSAQAQEKLTKAFAAMRKRGLIAHQRFSCCRSCASCEIANNIEAMTEKARAKVTGTVFYTKQGGFENGKDGTYLSFGQISSQRFGAVGLPTEDVGRITVECLEAAGLLVEWDGKADSSIWVAIAPPVDRTPLKTALSRISEAVG